MNRVIYNRPTREPDMHPTLAARRTRSARPAVELLERRETPATFSYKAGTLTAVVGEGDVLVFSGVTGETPGSIRVNQTTSSGTELYNGATRKEFATNLVIKCDQANVATVTLNSGLHVLGSVSITGAKTTTTLTSSVRVGRDFTFTGTGSARDDVRFQGIWTIIGGKLTAKLGEGLNDLYLEGGQIGGDVLLTGGSGNDVVHLLDDRDLDVGGTFSAALGDGPNSVRATDINVLRVGKDFLVSGSPKSGSTEIDFFGFGGNNASGDAALFVGRNLTYKVGPTATGKVTTNNFTVAGAMSVTGGDGITFKNPTVVLGNLTAKPGDGRNVFSTDEAHPFRVGGALTYAGGAAEDIVYLDQLTVTKGLSVNLGGNTTGNQQLLNVGLYAVNRSNVQGSVSIAGAGANNHVILRRLYAFGGLTIKTGAEADLVRLDDIDVGGATLIDLGAGNDNLEVDCVTTDSLGGLSGAVNFGGAVKLYGQAGNDTFNFSWTGGTLSRFASKLSIWGGSGDDDRFYNSFANTFRLTRNFEDCEANSGNALP